MTIASGVDSARHRLLAYNEDIFMVFTKQCWQISVAVVVFVVCATSTPRALPSYTLLDLGTLGGSTSAALAINEGGDVTGWSTVTGDTATHAFLYRRGVMLDLGTLGGRQSAGFDINARGDVVGEADTTSGFKSQHAFLYRKGALIDLGTLGGASQAVAVTASGEVLMGSGGHVLVYRNNSLTDLGNFGFAAAGPAGMNNRGDIIGRFVTSDNLVHGFLYHQGQVTDIGVLPGFAQTFPISINPRGDIVGSLGVGFGVPGRTQAFLYVDGVMTSFGPDATFPSSINDKGDIVGYVWDCCDGTTHAFLYANGEFTALNTFVPQNSGWSRLDVASGINNAGDIVGSGMFNGYKHAFVLTRND